MEAANLRDTNDLSGVRSLDCTWIRTVLVQRQMGPGPVIQLIDTIPIALIRGKSVTNGILGTAAQFGSTNHVRDVSSSPSDVVWSRASIPSPLRYRSGCWKRPAVPIFGWSRFHAWIALPYAH